MARPKIQTVVYLQDGTTVLIGTQLLEKIGRNLELDFVGGTFEFKDRPADKPNVEPKNS